MTDDPSKAAVAAPRTVAQEKKADAKHHDKAVQNTFPASDPPATTQPGSGITGPKETVERNPNR
jgi:hypothetical protein